MKLKIEKDIYLPAVCLLKKNKMRIPEELMAKDTFQTVTEKKARKIIEKEANVVFIHTKDSCPICDVFLPKVLKPVFDKEKYKDISIYQITESLTFPVGAHPQTYFFKDGICIQHPAGQTTIEVVENLLDTFYLGKPPSHPQPVTTVNTNVGPPKLG